MKAHGTPALSSRVFRTDLLSMLWEGLLAATHAVADKGSGLAVDAVCAAQILNTLFRNNRVVAMGRPVHAAHAPGWWPHLCCRDDV